MAGWAMVRRGGALRAPRRWVVLRSGSVCVLEGPDARSPLAVMTLNNAAVTTNPARHEAVVKSPDGQKMTFTWPCADDLHAFKAAFDFANRVIDSRFKTVSHRVLLRRKDSEIVFGFDKATGEYAAIKVLNKDRAHNKTIAECEVAIRMSIDHRTIVKTVDVFETPFDLFIVMAYMDGGSLRNRIISDTHEPITEQQTRVIMARLFLALGYLHARGIVHRNVKPENLLIESLSDQRWPDTVRLNDFSKACFLHPELAPSPEAADFAYQIAGSPDYLAPEAAVMITQPDGSRRPCLGPETDMWAAGVTLYNILSRGGLPFAGATTPELLRNARHTAVPFAHNPAFHHVSEASMSLIRSLLNPDRRKRPTAESVLYHPWFDNLDPHLPGPVMRAPPLVGYQKFRVAIASARFLSRICINTPGVSRKLTSTSKIQRFGSVGSSSASPAIITTQKGVDIAPAAAPRAFQPHFQHQSFPQLYHPPPGSLGFPSPATPPAPAAAPPFQFTTSTLSPTEGVLLRTSQTSSVGSQSFRSSHDSSRIVASEDHPSYHQLRQHQAEQARRYAHMELQQHQRELAFRAQHAADCDRRAADQSAIPMVTELQAQVPPPPYMNATPRNGAGGLIGGLLGAMQRDASPNTSNHGSRAASNLGGMTGTVPHSGGEASMDSTRSHMRTCGTSGRELSCGGDESMGSCDSSQTGSQSLQPPLSESRPGSDLQMIGGEFSSGSGMLPEMRADSAVELADLAPELTLSAGILPTANDQVTPATFGTTNNSLRYHSSGKGNLVQNPNPTQPGPHPSTLFQPDVEEKPTPIAPASGSKVKRSVRKKFDGFRNVTHGQFTAFGVYNGSKDKG